MASLLLNLIEEKEIELDPIGRPLYLYANTIHDFCERRTFLKEIFLLKRLEI
ncbi:hypothetical protein PL321_12210 [Caloramator sp. mosi_1]|uniref:hypothetical protein n=1 Tax=Caloramator sp. mosi_1 TaxID=3023090 RepID=UPI0023623E4D|nr:hypothetical protein [Caloramator sp. mosi_1]WDC83475.1 hypothetical protein PL321_12210 [Caloramator sp. mosi_1]